MRVLFLLLLLGTADVRNELTGQWVGTSICTEPRGACHDEIASYRVSKSDDVHKVTISFNKIVNGEEEVMGVNDCAVDAAAHTIQMDLQVRGNPYRWKFSWSGREMNGTLVRLSDGRIIRNVHVRKK
jgi:stress response protein SCP2